MYNPAAVLGEVVTVRVELALPPEAKKRLEGLTDAVGPDGYTLVAKLTLPLNPPMLLR